MNPDAVDRLRDALDACLAISRFASGKDFRAFLEDELLQSAIERKLMTLGEALRRARDFDPGVEAAIPDFRSIVGMRNHIAHGYDSVDHDAIWGAVRDKIPVLVEVLRRLIDS